MGSRKKLRTAPSAISDMAAELDVGGVLLQARRTLCSSRETTRLFYTPMDGKRVHCPSTQIPKAFLAWGAAFLRREILEKVNRRAGPESTKLLVQQPLVAIGHGPPAFPEDGTALCSPNLRLPFARLVRASQLQEAHASCQVACLRPVVYMLPGAGQPALFPMGYKAQSSFRHESKYLSLCTCRYVSAEGMPSRAKTQSVPKCQACVVVYTGRSIWDAIPRKAPCRELMQASDGAGHVPHP